MLIYGCEKDFDVEEDLQTVEESEEEFECPTGVRTDQVESCIPGTMSIMNGYIKFNSFDDFIQTVEFLGCANSDEYENWKNQISFETVSDRFKDFLDEINCDNSLSESDIDDILSSYNGFIQKVVNDSGEAEYSPIYNSYKSFRNIQGIFLIGDRIEAEFEGARISILNGDWQYPNVRIKIC